MFENCIIKMNDNVIYDSNKNYHYASYFLDMFDKSKEQKEGLMTSQLWYEDTPKHFDSATTDNKGWEARKLLVNLENIPMVGRLHSEIFNQERYMINDVTISVELTLAKSSFYIMANQTGTDKYSMKINEAKLTVPYVQIAEKTKEEIYKTLQSKAVVYPIQRINTKTIPIVTKSTTETLDISRGRLPKRIILGFVTDKAKAGDYKKNPFKFKGSENDIFEISKLELNVDGMPYAKRALKPDFSGDDIFHTFMNLYESLNYVRDGTNAPTIPLHEFEFGYCIFPFSLNPACCSDPGVFKKEGTVSLEITFKDAPKETLQAVVLCLYDNEITIDKNRQVETDW